jgi:monoterpene epsilon-lactone hydrolase
MAPRAAMSIMRPMAEDENVVAFPQAPEAIELRHLRSFVAVAEELNFGRAAERLYITQPALSRQIRALEQLLGCELLRRSTHRVELTIAGEALLDRTRPVLRDVDAAVSSVQSLGGELAGRVARLWEPVLQAAAADADIGELRDAYERMLANFEVPAEVSVRGANANGVTSLLVSPDSDQPPTLLHLHGGGYMFGSAFGHRTLGGALALAAKGTVLLPDYRLAPEHQFPAALDDAVAAYTWMLERGAEPQQLRISGDSSGGGLAVSTLLALRERGVPLPGGVILMCPFVDMEMRLRDEESARRTAEAYLGDHPDDDPIVSPLRADLSGLPPMLIQAATGDHWRLDSQALTERAREHGVDVQLELYSVDAHVFQLFWSFLPEAAEALQSAGQFARDAGGGRKAKSA